MVSIVEDYVPFLERKVFRVGPKKYCMPSLYKEFGPEYFNFDVRANDIWLFGFPRSGTTLTQEAIWLLGNNLNYEKAAATENNLRFPVLEFSLYKHRIPFAPFNNETTQLINVPALERLNNMTERRFIKTHIPISLSPSGIFSKNCKVFFIYRNPKDVIVSNYHFYRDFFARSHDITFKDYWDNFKNDNFWFTPYFEHLKEGWNLKGQKNCKILFYDQFIINKIPVLKDIAEFLEQKYSDEELKQLEEHLNIENFRNNRSVNQEHVGRGKTFIRKGKSGGWKEYFTGGLEQEVDQWIRENLKDPELLEYFNNNL